MAAQKLKSPPNNKKVNANTPSTENKHVNIAELRKFQSDYDKKTENFAAVKDAIQLLDLTKTETRSFTTFSKETLRSYLKNPKSNETNLRNLSKFLYRLSQPYRRIIGYNSEMIDLTATSVIPLIDLTKDNAEDKILKTYYNTLLQLKKMQLEKEITKCALIAWREDTFYGYVYEDDNGFFIMPMNGDYCRVSSVNYDNTLNFAYDFSYFRSHTETLEYWDKEFNSKYTAYQKDPNLRWQELDPARTICLKINIDDYTMSLPPYIALFETIIDLIDLQSIQAVKDNLSIYKLLVARLKPLSGTDSADDFEVDINTAIEYYNKLSESLPDYVSSCISPLPIEAVEFKGNNTEDTDMIANSQSNLFKTSGGSQVLDNKKQGTTIFEAQILSDESNALGSILPQIEKWINRYLTYVLGDHAYVKYMKVSQYTKDKKKKSLLESGNNGVPVKLAVAALDGFDALETLSLDFLENKVLKLHETWIPFSTSYTQSGNATTPKSSGGQTKDTPLTDEGDATKQQGKNKM